MHADTSPTASLLRLMAFLGTGAVLLWHVVSMPELQPRQGAGFILLIVALLAVGLTLLILLPDATSRLLRNKDLLIPLGLFITISAIFNFLATLPVLAAFLTPSWTLKLLTFSFSLSLSFVFNLLLSIIFVGWTTLLISQVVVLGRLNLIADFTTIGQWFWRVLGLELFGWGIGLFAAACALVTGAVSVPLALILLGITSLLWNLATAAVLPVALADPQSFGQAVRHGVAVSRAGMRKWAPLVITQMLLLGWVTFIHVSYTTSETKYGNTTTITQTGTTKTNWGVNSFWIGGYADDCKWHGSLMADLEAKPVQLVDTLLTMLFAVLAIVIKLRIVHDVFRPAFAHDETPQFTQLNLTSYHTCSSRDAV